MKKSIYKTALAGLFAIVAAIFGCTKLDTTTLGTDVIPIVDNINTFADTFDISTSQHIFDDTVRISNSDNHVVGQTNDPLFGRTEASMYFQFKPGFFPYYYGSTLDTIIGLDSVVLSLAYKGFYGDSSLPLNLQVLEVAQNAGGLWDSATQNRPLSYEPPTTNILGSRTVDIRDLKNQVKFAHNKDSATNLIRIKLTDPRLSDIFSMDSTRNGMNNGFYNDSLFRRAFNGMGLRSTSGNALLYINLIDDKSRLEFHFRKRKNNVVDTIFSSFQLYRKFDTTIHLSVTANHIVRDRSSGQYPPLNTDVSEIYLQTTPGTYSLLKIPRLTTWKDTNRIVHRAEIFMQQLPGDFLTDSIFPPPNFLYLDLKDTSATERYKPVYYDLNPSVSYNPDSDASRYWPGDVDYAYFGGYQRRRYDATAGRTVAYYNFNITRHIQKMLLEHKPNYVFRLFSPYSINYSQFGSTALPYSNSLAFGRVRVGGGTHPVHPMKMVVIWSKIK